MINIRSRTKELADALNEQATTNHLGDTVNDGTEELDTLATTAEYWGAVNPPLRIHLAMNEEVKEQW